MIDFPASPTVGQQFTAAGVTWTWDGAKWTASGFSASTTTWNPSDLSAGITLSGGNLVAAVGGSGGGVRSIFGTSSGKYYFECAFGISGPSLSLGVANSSAILSSVSSTGANAAVANNAGTVAINGANMGTGLLGAFSAGGVCGIAIDLGAQLIWFRNGAAGNWNGSGTANPATGTGGFSISALGSVAIFALADGSGAPPGSITGNFGATAFVGTAPSGFVSGFYGSAYLPLAGGTMTGPIVLAADPAANLQPATKQYVDNKPLNDNRIINGNFAVNQRGQVSGTALAAAAYGHDRWKAGASGCTYTFTAALPDTTITITAGTLTQVIEAGMIEGGVYTLSWTGTAQARVYQGTPTGSYAASPIVTASLPAGVNTIVEFNTGTVVRGKFEIGSAATPFNRQSLAKSMADCQRYYVGVGFGLTLNGYASGAGYGGYISWAGPVTMRAAPTISAAWGSGVNANAGAIATVPDNRTIYSSVSAAAAGQFSAVLTITSLSAEL